MDQAQANADLAQAAGLIAGALGFYETNMPSAEITMIHGVLSRLAARSEAIAGVSAGTFNVQPADGGTNKPPA